MSSVGRWAAAGAAVVGLILLGTWDVSTSSGPASGAESKLDGEQLFRAKGCGACHAGPTDDRAATNFAPSLSDAPAWAGDRRPGMTAEDYLAESIAAPDAFLAPGFRPGSAGPMNAMPQLTATAEEIRALVDYLLRR